MKHVILLFILITCGVASATSVVTPKIKVDPKSTIGMTNNPNVRCTVIAAGDDGVVVDLMIKEGFIDVGVNLTVYSGAGTLFSVLIAPQSSGVWKSYSFTLHKKYLDQVSIDLYRSKQSYRLNLKGLPISTKTKKSG